MRHSLILAASLALIAVPGCGDDGGGDTTTSTTTASTTMDPSSSGGSGSTTDGTSTSGTSSTSSGGSSSTTSTTGGSTGGGSTGGGSTGGGSTGSDTTGGAAQFNPTDTKCDIFCGDYFAACNSSQGNDYGDEATCVGQCQSWTAAQWDKRQQALNLAMAGDASTQCVGASMFAQ
jgi:hypothetical protein